MKSKKILFYRDYQGFTGGHLKVFNYFEHVKHSNNFNSKIYFSKNSNYILNNSTSINSEDLELNWEPELADVLFVAGLDWSVVPFDIDKPVINLIQHVRHADPNDFRYNFLRRPAIRICVSQAVADAIISTGIVNGKTFVIKNGVDPLDFPEKNVYKDNQVLIAGYKKPELAAQIAQELNKLGIKNHLLIKMHERFDYLSLVARSAITIFLPCESEGFYLPALEGMGLGTLVICPDCIGNNEFCFHMQNCIVPIYSLEGIISSCCEAMEMLSTNYSEKIRTNGELQFKAHSLKEERARFIEILNSIDIG
ncbi:glycosyltransferase [Limnohabitans planktonicus]|uniref:glycosyltransferase n=1 Tax=Limnohabitans planktonicus TaxID=540060 RepID=UPI000A5C0FDC|nr:glycosyltransferase family 1 protein [Limnohabitans planktonicus]